MEIHVRLRGLLFEPSETYSAAAGHLQPSLNRFNVLMRPRHQFEHIKNSAFTEAKVLSRILLHVSVYILYGLELRVDDVDPVGLLVIPESFRPVQT